MDDDAELYVWRPPDPGDGWRIERERLRRESRRRHLERMQEVLALADACTDGDRERAEAVLDGFFGSVDRETGEPCPCSRHPQLPETDLHDHGSGCRCRRTATEREAHHRAWLAEHEAFWASPEGREIEDARRAEDAALADWLAARPGVDVTSHGGYAPEQWRGSVDGHTFYFRERHDHWRIELDLVPSGRVVEVWRGADPTDESERRFTEIDEGEVIAEGVTSVDGYGETPVERAAFIVATIRTHLHRRDCTVHADRRAELERLLGATPMWCPACGQRL